ISPLITYLSREGVSINEKALEEALAVLQEVSPSQEEITPLKPLLISLLLTDSPNGKLICLARELLKKIVVKSNVRAKRENYHV
ncbi:MAG: hypothetical protein ACFFDI_14265, partial [Promethearchaeota archaeon]